MIFIVNAIIMIHYFSIKRTIFPNLLRKSMPCKFFKRDINTFSIAKYLRL